MAEGADLGKIVSLIMENPRLIEEISNLGKAHNNEPAADTPPLEKSDDTRVQSVQGDATDGIVRPKSSKNRSQLLFALKPYVSVERAQAIDSMLSIVEILDAMKGR